MVKRILKVLNRQLKDLPAKSEKMDNAAFHEFSILPRKKTYGPE